MNLKQARTPVCRTFFALFVASIVTPASALEMECAKALVGGSYSVTSRDLPQYVPPDALPLVFNHSERAKTIRDSVDAACGGTCEKEVLVHVDHLASMVPFFIGILDRIGADDKKEIEAAMERYWAGHPDFDLNKGDFPILEIGQLKREALKRLRSKSVSAYWMDSFVARVLFIRDLEHLRGRSALSNDNISALVNQLASARGIPSSAHRLLPVPVFNLIKSEDFFPYWLNGLNPQSVNDVSQSEPYDGINPSNWSSRTATGFNSHDQLHSLSLSKTITYLEKLAQINGIQKTRTASFRDLFRTFWNKVHPDHPDGREILNGFLRRGLALIDETEDKDLKEFFTNLTWMMVHEYDPNRLYIVFAAYSASVSRPLPEFRNQSSLVFMATVKSKLEESLTSTAGTFGSLSRMGWIFPASWRTEINGSITRLRSDRVLAALKDYFFRVVE